MPKVIVFGVDGLSMPLLQRYAAQGVLPNISAMLREGAAAELLPYISAWGDVNFVSFMTGQAPGTAWQGQAMPADNAERGNLLAALARAGQKAALVHFPETVAAEAPHFTWAPYWGRAQSWPGEIFKPSGHTTRYAAHTGHQQVKQQKLGWPPSSSLAYHDKGTWQALEQEGDRWRMTLHGEQHHVVLTLSLQQNHLVLHLPQREVVLQPHAWSEWISLSALDVPGSVRFWLGRCDAQQNDIEILQSQVTHSQGLASDTATGKTLLQQGPWFSKWVMKAAPDEAYLDATWQEGDQQSRWLAASALQLTQQQGFSLWATVHRLVDESHHNCLGQSDPASPFYDAQQAERYEAVMRECYRLLDDTLGVLRAEMDADTTLLMVSDHGAVPNAWMCDINRYLAKHGLVSLTPEGDVERASSKVYLKDERGGLEIFVNLQGREADGIVPPEAFQAVCEHVQHALGNWHVQHKGELRNAVSIVLQKEDAAAIGFWGACAGDIVFAYNTGFVWGTSRGGEDICPVDVPGANHGPQKPTAQTAMSSNYGALLAVGAGIRKGYYHDRHQRGPFKMIDPAATIAHLLGLDPSRLEGRVMHEILDDTLRGKP